MASLFSRGFFVGRRDLLLARLTERARIAQVVDVRSPERRQECLRHLSRGFLFGGVGFCGGGLKRGWRLRKLFCAAISFAMLGCAAHATLVVANAAVLPQSSAAKTEPARIVTDETGRRVAIPADVKRVVTLAPNLTETIYALGLEERLAGDTDYCDTPPAAKLKPHVGGAQNPSLEAIVALHPDSGAGDDVDQPDRNGGRAGESWHRGVHDRPADGARNAGIDGTHRGTDGSGGARGRRSSRNCRRGSTHSRLDWRMCRRCTRYSWCGRIR